MTNSEFYSLNNQQPLQQNQFNGRIFFPNNQPLSNIKDFEMYNNANQAHYMGSRLNNQIEANNLSNAFFSSQNVDAIQMGIRNTVRNICQQDSDPILVGHKPINIARQNDTELHIIMRSIYLQYGRNLPVGIGEQVAKLNNVVIRESVPKIISALKQKIKYLDDIQKLPTPLEHPSYEGSKGLKQGNISEVFHGGKKWDFNLF